MGFQSLPSSCTSSWWLLEWTKAEQDNSITLSQLCYLTMVRKQCSSMSQSPMAMPLWGRSEILHSPSLLWFLLLSHHYWKPGCVTSGFIYTIYLTLSAHLGMAGISPSFMSYPPAVFSCHCIPDSTAQQTGLWQAKFFCHHFLPPLPVLFLPVTVQLSSVTSPGEGCCSVLADQPLQYSIPSPCNKWRDIKGRVQCISEHETWSGDMSPGLPGQIFALFSNFTTLELLSSFPSASCSHCLVKPQTPNTSPPQWVRLCKLCCHL